MKSKFDTDTHFTHVLSTSCRVLISSGNQDVVVKQKSTDKIRRILVLGAPNYSFALKNLYNANTKKGQISVIIKLSTITKFADIDSNVIYLQEMLLQFLTLHYSPKVVLQPCQTNL